jgi:predicted nuclease of predicted toxin-antitoxin system
MPATAAARLREHGHDVVLMAERAPGADDDAVIATARADQRILLTFDKDFGERIFLQGENIPGLILFRKTRAMPRVALAEWIAQVVLSRSDWEGSFSTVTSDSRIRMRSLKLRS